MGITYNATLKTTRMQDVVNAIDAGSGGGVLEIGTASMALLLAEFPLAQPCGVVTGSVLDFDFDPDIEDVSANNGGTAAAAQIKDSSGNVVVSGLTVGTSGTDVIIDNATIVAGQTVRATLGSFTHG